MLWKDQSVPLTLMALSGGFKRAFAGMPFQIGVATGLGRIAFSRDATGELVVLPLHPGMEVDVREHAFLIFSARIRRDTKRRSTRAAWYSSKALCRRSARCG